MLYLLHSLVFTDDNFCNLRCWLRNLCFNLETACLLSTLLSIDNDVMLCLQEDRLSVDDALQHPYFQSYPQT